MELGLKRNLYCLNDGIKFCDYWLILWFKPEKMTVKLGRYLTLCLLILIPYVGSTQAFLHTPIEGIYGEDFIIVNYVDWGEGNHILDHQCGSKAYDGHQGTDFVLRSFKSMDSGVYVLAAADGVVAFVLDGLFDREKISDPAKGFGNYIAIRHPNGYYSYYAHLAAHSILVEVGETVSAGDRIALVGSSGNSSDPHLHFELWWDSLQVVDPFKGICGNDNSLWLDTLPYDTTFGIWTSGLTNFIPDLDTLREEPTKIHHFSSEDEAISYWAILYGLWEGDELTIDWFDPDETLWFTFSYELPNDAWYFYFWSYINVPLVYKPGQWSARLYRNATFVNEINFTLEPPSSVSEIPSEIFTLNYPNPFHSSTTIYWEAPTSGHTSLELFDIDGKKVKNLLQEFKPKGKHSISLSGSELPLGTYFYRLKIDNKITTRKISILR